MKIFRRKVYKEGEYTQKNRVSLVKGGRPFFKLIVELIEKAQYTIHLQFYIYEHDETGVMVGEALKKAAARGVDVYLHVDAYASKKLSKEFIAGLKEAGVHFKRFEPVFKSRHFYVGRRMHHKVFVADSLYSLVGGINISDRYNDMAEEPAWLDMAIYCEGEASVVLHKICRTMWRTDILPDKFPPGSVEEFCKKLSEGHPVRVSRNDWVKKKIEIFRNYEYMLRHAENEITIMCSYFLPGRLLRRHLTSAVNRGVKIRVILAGKSDIMIAKNAERFLYDWLFKRKIGIYEYQKTVLHAKVALYDDLWSTVGSFNVNNISAYASLELNLDVKDKRFAVELEKQLESIISRNCEKITEEDYKSSTNFLKKLWQRLCYGFVNMMLRIFTFYFRQE